MPKRKNPFGEITPIQLKTHVSAKHLASKEDMEEVYRKTRERLKEGQDKLNSKSTGASNLEENGKLRAVSRKCRCCNCWLTVYDLFCDYCQFKICSSSCLRECYVCGKSFCHFCTVLNYDKSEVRTFCLNCLSSFSF